MDKDTALDLALEELENCADLLKVFEAPIDSCVGATMLRAEAAITAIKQARSAPIAFAGYHTMTDKIEIFMTEKQAIDWRDQYQPGFARVEKLVSNGVVE